MNVWIDVAHVPQLNFYKPLINALSENGHHVYVTALERGKLPMIAKKELGGMENVSVEVIGRHRMSKWSAIIEANLLRIPLLWFWAIGKKIDVAFCNHHQASIIARLLGIPGYAFGDDPETKIYPAFVKMAM